MRALILGAGGTGRELSHRLRLAYTEVKFLDDHKTGDSILGKISEYVNFSPRYTLYAALGSYRSMKIRKSILEPIPLNYFGTYIDSGACAYEIERVPRGSLIFCGSTLTSDITLHRHVLIYHNVVISHDCTIGDYSIVANGAVISGNVTVGDMCYIGAGSVVKENCKIGAGTIIAAGATVMSDVPEKSIYLHKNDIRTNVYL